MEYMLCYPPSERMDMESCDKVHNILARMSDKYKLRIEPEKVKSIYFKCPEYYHRYRIYKPIREKDASGGEAYLMKEEEDMILSVCRTSEEKELMKDCIYAYQYDSGLVLKSFRDRDKKH